jgi:DNA-binding ferritin-like protein
MKNGNKEKVKTKGTKTRQTKTRQTKTRGMKTRGMKTRKNKRTKQLKKYTEQKIVIMFLQMLNTVKLYHWKTKSYAQHKATDELYGNLNTNIDSFVEIMLGKSGGRINLTQQKTIPLLDYTNVSDFTKEVNKYKQFLIEMNTDYILNITNNSDLLNIRDELLGNLNQFTYLLTFK